MSHLLTITDGQFVVGALAVGFGLIAVSAWFIARIEDMAARHRELDAILARYSNTEAGEVK